MEKSVRVYLFILLGLAVLVMLAAGSAGMAVPAAARQPALLYQQATGICYAAADNEDIPPEIDFLSQVDYISGQETGIGYTGTKNIEAIAYQASTDRLFAANGGQVGTLDLSSGGFSALPQPVGKAGGEAGDITLNDIDGLAFDPGTGILYGTHRRASPPTQPDVLFQIDTTSGRFIPGAFGTDVDYVIVDPIENFNDIDDIAIDIIDGQMYGIANNGGVGDRLVKIDKTDGSTTDVGALGVDDMEGLSFDPTGQLLGTTGKAGGTTKNSLFHINKTTGAADISSAVVLTAASDYEAVDCLTSWTVEPTRTPTPQPTNTPTPTPTATMTATPSPTPEFTLTPTPTAPTAIELLYFRVDAITGVEVTLGWATAAEIDTYGFNLYRSADANFSHASLVHFQEAQGGSVNTFYTYRDSVPSEGQWWYWLEEVETGGGKNLHGPVLAYVGVPAPQIQLFIPFVVQQSLP